jgi:general secretion pathway protein L
MFAGRTGPRDVTLALAPKLVLRRRLTLPAAVEDNLRATIGYDLDRLTPFKAEDVAFDAAVVERDSARRTIGVDLVAVRRRALEQAIALARSFGANVVAVVPGAPQDAATSPVNLLAPEDRAVAGGFLRWHVLAPLALLCALVVAIIVVPLWQKREYAIAMMNAADQAAIRAQISDRLRSEVDRMVGEYNFALERKFTTPGVAQVLNELTKLLPDDTWLTQFEVKSTIRGKTTQREVFMRGESANAGKLISLLENATLVGHAAPRSPTTKLQPGPGESFDIGAQLKPTPVPEKIALTESMKAPTPRAAAAAPQRMIPAPASAAPAPPAAASAAPPVLAPGIAAKATADANATPEAAPAPPAAAPPTVAPGRAGRAARLEARRGRGRGGANAPVAQPAQPAQLAQPAQPAAVPEQPAATDANAPSEEGVPEEGAGDDKPGEDPQ